MKLNAIGKPYSVNFDPNYKLKGVHTSTARLRSPYRRVKFVGEELRETQWPYRRQQPKDRKQQPRAGDYQTRLVVLHELNRSITKFRESQKLDPIDDPVDDDAPPNAFQVIRGILLSQSFPQSRESPSEHPTKCKKEPS